MSADKLEAMLDLVNLEIDHVNEYRSGGGMERITETADRMRKLTALQVNIIEMLIQETTPQKISWKEIIDGHSNIAASGHSSGYPSKK